MTLDYKISVILNNSFYIFQLRKSAENKTDMSIIIFFLTAANI